MDGGGDAWALDVAIAVQALLHGALIDIFNRQGAGRNITRVRLPELVRFESVRLRRRLIVELVTCDCLMESWLECFHSLVFKAYFHFYNSSPFSLCYAML